MSLSNVGKMLLDKSGRTGLLISKKSPEILMVVGVAGVITSTVMACKATLKSEELIKEARQKLDSVKEAKETFDLEDYSEADYKKDLVVIYTQTSVNFIRLYGPSICLGVLSIACLIGSHDIMKKRNFALMAAYKTIDEAYHNYRNRVKEAYGEDVDYAFKNNLRTEEVVENETDENGKTRKVKKTKFVAEDPNGYSQYSRFFDDGCTQWSKTPEYNFMFLRAQQNYFNDMLKARGHVFLNEIYDSLGIPRTQAGAVVGWVLGQGDDYIDFGIFDGDKVGSRNLVNGYEPTILLDFNVDGVIYDLI